MVGFGSGIVNHLAEGVDDGDVANTRHLVALVDSHHGLVETFRPSDGRTIIVADAVFVLANGQFVPTVIHKLGLGDLFGDELRGAAIALITVDAIRIAYGDVVDVESVFKLSFGELVAVFPC